MARSTADDDYPWATPAEALIEAGTELVAPYWGQGASIEFAAPSQADNPESRAFFARLERASASPGMLASLFQMYLDIDVRDVVAERPCSSARPSPRAATVSSTSATGAGSPSTCRTPGSSSWRVRTTPRGTRIADTLLGEVQEFLTGTRDAPEPERALATVAVH